MSMGEPHAHIRESRESLSESSLILLLQILRWLCESLRFIVNSVFFRRSASTPSSANRRLDSVRSGNDQSPRVHIKELDEHGRTTCTYGGVNGVTFRFIAQYFALA